ncbi:conserved hypothetical protein, partial [Ricinus communis]
MPRRADACPRRSARAGNPAQARPAPPRSYRLPSRSSVASVLFSLFIMRLYCLASSRPYCGFMPSACSNMPASPPRVTAAYLQPLLETAAARGIDPAALASEAGLAAIAPDPLPAADYIALLDAGSRLAGDPHFGLH